MLEHFVHTGSQKDSYLFTVRFEQSHEQSLKVWDKFILEPGNGPEWFIVTEFYIQVTCFFLNKYLFICTNLRKKHNTSPFKSKCHNGMVLFIINYIGSVPIILYSLIFNDYFK